MKNNTFDLTGWMGRLMLVVCLVLVMSGMATAWDIAATSITNTTGKSGRMYFTVVDQYNNPVAGGSLPPGATSGMIRGVPSGTFTLNAFIDTQGTGFQHANDPFVSLPMTVSANGGGPAVFSNPAGVATVTPAAPQVMPLDKAAFVNFKPDKNNNLPIADKHTIYWSTSNSPGPNQPTGGSLVLSTREPKAVIYNLTNGTSYYFAIRAENSVNTSLSPVTGPIIPVAPTVTPSTVNVPVDTTGIPKINPLTSLIVALSDNNNSTFFNYFKVPSDVQTVPVTGVKAGLYKIYTILDLSGTGNLDDPRNVSTMNETDRTQKALPVMVDGVSATITAPTTRLAVKNSAVAVTTSHSRQNGSDSYNLEFNIAPMSKQLVNVTLESGPQVSGPIDLGMSSDNGKNGGYGLSLQVPNRPTVGDLYHFSLYYADTPLVPELRTAAVTGVLDNFPANTFPVGSTGPGSVSPTFGWTNPGNLPDFLTSSINMNNNNLDFLSMAVLSAVPQGASFPVGQTYNWDRTIQDFDGNQARQSISFTPGNSGPVISDFNPKSGAAGATVIITGSSFDSTPGNNMVTFNGSSAPVTSASPTSLTVTSPNGGTPNTPVSSGLITVTVGGVTAGSSAVFNATTTFSGATLDNNGANLSGVNIFLAENPAVAIGSSDTSVSPFTNFTNIPVPARPYFSMMFSKSSYYPTYTALISITAPSSGSWGVFNSGDLLGRAVLPPFGTGKGVIIGRVVDYTAANGNNYLAGAVVTATSLIHPDVNYIVKYTDGSTEIAQDPATTIYTSTAATGRFYVVNVDEGDYVTVTASHTNMGFQTRVFNTHGDAVSSQSVRGAAPGGTPIATPAGGSYPGQQTVTLSGGGLYDSIVYTTNGSDPTVFGTTYRAPILISTDTTLKFATKNINVGQAFSAVQTQVYTIGAGITGHVSDANTSAALQFVNVQLYDQNGSFLQSTNTDNSGNYLFSGLAANNFKVCFYPNQGYISQCWQNTTANPSSATSIPVTTTHITGINAALQTGATITGKVTLDGANGIQNVWIGASDTNGNQVPGIGATTDASGNYTLSGLPTGTYKLNFNGQSSGYISQWYNNKTDATSADPVSVTSGNTYPGFNAQLVPGGTISGRVTNSGATGIQNVSVQLRDTSGNWIPNINGAMTDGSGNYTLGGIPAGNYKLYFDGTSTIYISQWYSGVADQSLATVLNVVAGVTLTGKNAVLAQGATISGTVSNGASGIQNVSVQLYNSNGSMTLSNTNTDASGGYQFSGLLTGTYRVCFTPGQTNYIAKCFNNQVYNPAAATDITVSVPGGNNAVNATMTLGGAISGQVTNGSSGIQNISVEARDTTNGNPIPGAFGMWTDSSGNYTIRGIPAGNIKVYFNPNGTSYAGQWYNNKTTLASSDTVSISAGLTTSLATVVLQPATIPGAPIITSIVPGNGQVQVNFTVPTSDGGLPIFDYTVTVNPGNITGFGYGSPITVYGLTSGQQYTIAVTARNNLGNSAAATIPYYLPWLVYTGADLQAAVNTAAANGVIWSNAQTATVYTPPLMITKGVTLSGGYSLDYSTVSGFTTIPGRVNIKGTGFKVIFKNVKVKAP